MKFSCSANEYQVFRRARCFHLFVFVAVCVFTLSSREQSLGAETWGEYNNSFSKAYSALSVLSDAFLDESGLTNPASPFVWPAYFGAELSIRYLSFRLNEAQVRLPAQGIVIDLEGGNSVRNRSDVIEFMGRVQVGRLSVRGYYDVYVSDFSGGGGEAQIDWPNLGFGLDFDLLYRKSLRFGLDADFVVQHPQLRFFVPGNLPRFTRVINFYRPQTWGVHLIYNPFGWGGMSPSLEARYRLPFRGSGSGGGLTQFEIMGGLKTPETIFGTTALRIGWRYSQAEYRSQEPNSHNEVDLTWYGFFGELVWYY